MNKKNLKSLFIRLTIVTFLLVASTGTLTANQAVNSVAVNGYDLVSYFTASGPVRGSGLHTVEFAGDVYLFANEENQAKFQQNPAKYLPQYGGFCAYGVAIGKKFSVDPLVYEIINGKLYFNLNNEIKAKWSQEKGKYIQDADRNWKQIRDKNPSEL